MQETWQNAIVLAVVALAAIYLTIRAAGIFRRKKGAACGGCHGCSASESASPKLVSIGMEPMKAPPGRERPSA